LSSAILPHPRIGKMKGLGRIWLAAVAVAVLASGEAAADELCGRKFVSFDELYRDVADARHQIMLDNQKAAMFIDESGTIWRFTKANHPAVPAVACVRGVLKGQRTEFERQFWCRALSGCDAFIADLIGPFEWK
jgi:hypothetical protein